MKNVKRVISMLLIMMLVFTACSNSTDKSGDKSATSEQDTKTGDDDSKSTDSGGSDSDATQAQSGGILRIGDYVLDTQMNNKNPYLVSGVWVFAYPFQYEKLFYANPVTGEIEPALAEEFTWNDDYSQFTSILRDGVKWHDGEPFTADDVVYTYQNLIDYPVLDRYGIGKRIKSIEADGNKVIFNFNSTFTAFKNFSTAIFIVPKHLWDGNDPSTYLNEQPVGTGPFMWTRYNTGVDVEFTANKDYWGGTPKLDGINVLMYNSAPNLTLALLKGDIEATSGAMAMSSAPEILSKDNSNIQLYSGQTNFVIAMNNEKPGLSDPVVRQAMVMAVDRAKLIAKGEYNAVSPVSLGWLPDLFGDVVSDEANQLGQFDIAAAKQLLEDAGYTLGKDKIYQKDGVKLSFTYYNASGAPAQQMEAGMVQQWLLNLGVEIIPKLATWPELIGLGMSGNYDLCQLPVAFPFDPEAALSSSFNSSMTAPTGELATGTNYFRYRNVEVDSLFEELGNTIDTNKRKELFHNIQVLVANDYPFIPMYNIGGHIPYFDDEFGGFPEDRPIFESTQSMINIYKK
ncbi:peptide ABC transporter substrate-binding protein [Vallitalea pronyensis]|uniref:Peptide ABC transporter substrate-binding protein n=1 Tax=Vallitalea pronyensis TaxID=1348613 RepID=A0A8J8MP52_9FIRM|nr:peptide ABC transporter substrate-binding protein [Vallitalea pronyensis]QUI24798.1 peptide ABC transporter substrate-binding protein [Vallitalea pronyensis]